MAVDDLVEVVAAAQALQDAERDPTRNVATLDEVRVVAQELDIDPRFVEPAVRDLAVARDSKARTKRLVRAALLASTVGIPLLTALLAGVGAGTVNRAARDAAAAERALDAALERQAALAPQLVAMAGGDATELAELAGEVRAGHGADDRLAASAALGSEMASAFARLPVAADDATSQQRMNLQYEVIGTGNRIAAERKRWEEAYAGWESAASGISGGLATGLRLAPAPRR